MLRTPQLRPTPHASPSSSSDASARPSPPCLPTLPSCCSRLRSRSSSCARFESHLSWFGLSRCPPPACCQARSGGNSADMPQRAASPATSSTAAPLLPLLPHNVQCGVDRRSTIDTTRCPRHQRLASNTCMLSQKPKQPVRDLNPAAGLQSCPSGSSSRADWRKYSHEAGVGGRGTRTRARRRRHADSGT